MKHPDCSKQSGCFISYCHPSSVHFSVHYFSVSRLSFRKRRQKNGGQKNEARIFERNGLRYQIVHGGSHDYWGIPCKRIIMSWRVSSLCLPCHFDQSNWTMQRKRERSWTRHLRQWAALRCWASTRH